MCTGESAYERSAAFARAEHALRSDSSWLSCIKLSRRRFNVTLDTDRRRISVRAIGGGRHSEAIASRIDLMMRTAIVDHPTYKEEETLCRTLRTGKRREVHITVGHVCRESCSESCEVRQTAMNCIVDLVEMLPTLPLWPLTPKSYRVTVHLDTTGIAVVTPGGYYASRLRDKAFAATCAIQTGLDVTVRLANLPD